MVVWEQEDAMDYIQDENETSDWLIYAEYVEWMMSKGVSQPNNEDRCCEGSQQEQPLTD
jgi:hypothetical protein